MSDIDISIFVVYFIAMLGVGLYFLRRNKTSDDYFVGGRKMNRWHVGLSVVATDVGGGFSIGLGGLGFTMGLSGSWMLFTGLIGAWVSGALLIPKISALAKRMNMQTFPQVFEKFYGREVALLAGVISLVGYLGFTSSQLLAGAKLTSATMDGISMDEALIAMGVIAVGYTVMGGLKAVIYTDTIQWIILMSGLIFIGIPFAYDAVGGMEGIRQYAAPEMMRFNNLRWVDLVNWAITIIPIWFVGMTLYQRIYACRNEEEARKAWYIAGVFEWPIMALMGVALGLLANVAYQQGILDGVLPGDAIDAEQGLPLLLKSVLPVGILGLMLSAYFSAILSTADSCLMAASGNMVTDIVQQFFRLSEKRVLRASQIMTLVLGTIALVIAFYLENVLEVMLMSYAFMVSGLLMPVMGVLFWKRLSTVAAIVAMVAGGSTTVSLMVMDVKLPFDLDPNAFGITISLILFTVLTPIFPNNQSSNNPIAQI